MFMLSFEFFCHKKEEPNKVIQVVARQEGFVQLPEKYEDIFQNGGKLYEGLASINGKNLLDPSMDPLNVEDIEGCSIVSPTFENKADADNALLSNLLDDYAEKHDLALSDKISLQKICLSLNEKLAQNSGYVYVNLRNCENAPLVLDTVKSLFEGFDVLFTLPKNLQFSVPFLKVEKPRKKAEGENNNLSLEEGYQTFFDDVCGIASPDLEHIQKAKKKKQSKPAPSKPEPVSLKKIEKPVKESGFLKPGSKIEKSVKKDLGGNVLFSFVFLALSIAAPYFYFGLLSQSASLYFAIYLTLDVFFLTMCSIALSYVTDGKSKVTKGYYYLAILLSPALEVAATIVFYYVAKSQSWLGAEAYAFFGLGLGYILMHPLVIWVRKRYQKAKKKAKTK